MRFKVIHKIEMSRELTDILSNLVRWLTKDSRIATMRLVIPVCRSLETGEVPFMPTSVMADLATLVPIEFDNPGGTPVAPPTGGTATVTNDNPGACNTSIETDASGNLVLVLSPVQPGQLGAICNISVSDVVDGNAISTATVDFELVNDPIASNAHLNTGGMTTRPLGP